MSAKDSQPQIYNGYDELIQLVLMTKDEAEKKYWSPRMEENPYYLPKHPTMVYENWLLSTDKGLAPIGFKKFTSWDNWLANKREEQNDIFDEDPEYTPSGYLYMQYELPFWKDENNPFFYVISTLRKTSEFDKSLIMSCHHCKFSVGIPVNHRNTGNRCQKFGTQAMYEVNLPPSQQSYYFSFPMYPKTMECSEFLWRREDTAFLKFKLKEAKHSEQCCFCKEFIQNVESAEIVVHHKTPIEIGGGHNIGNLEFAHNTCHDEYHRNDRKFGKSQIK